HVCSWHPVDARSKSANMVGFWGAAEAPGQVREQAVGDQIDPNRSFANECADPASCWLSRFNPEAIGSKVPLLFRLRADRVEIAIDEAGPEGRGRHHPVPVPARHLEIEERTLPTRRLERGKVRAAVAVEGVVVAVEPQGR